MPKTKSQRKIGEKPKRVHRPQLKLPPFPDLRTPNGYTALTDFILSCEGEVPVEEAIKDFQENWCDHPRSKRQLVATIAEPAEERFEYTVACEICGRHKQYKGRPSKELK